MAGARMSVVIPAHNEARVLAVNLTALLADAWPGEFDVVVVCNGCTDDTAAVARRVPGIRVVELTRAGKAGAMRHGDSLTTVFPRLYLDADVQVSTRSARLLAEAVDVPGMLAVGPDRRFDLAASALLVRAYYSVWNSLPEVRQGLFGRGAIVLSERGCQRMRALPDARSDDLAVHLAFSTAERRVVSGAVAVIRPPRTSMDLFRRRIRALQGSRELQGAAAATSRGGTSWADLRAAVADHPAALAALPVFLGYGIAARLAVKWGRFDRAAWLRDESSRSAPVA
jgi:hypothetical protein